MRIINKMFRHHFAMLCALLLCAAPVSGKAVDIDFYVNPQVSVVSVDEDSRDRNAQIAYKVEKGSEIPTGGYQIITSGQGDYDIYTGIRWETVSWIDVKDGLIQPRRSVRKIFDQDVLVATVEHEYDYDKGVVMFQRKDGAGKVVKYRDYSMKGPTCDDTNLAQFIRGIYVEGLPDEYRKFYLLSNEPMLYRVKTYVVGKEKLDLPGGPVEAVKLQLMADLGPLTAIAAQVVGPTYIWLDAEYPHRWLQYEGREAGKDSDVVKTFVLDYGKIKP